MLMRFQKLLQSDGVIFLQKNSFILVSHLNYKMPLGDRCHATAT